MSKHSLAMLPSKGLGFYGGTFDPPHIGHLNLAIQIMEQQQLPGVLFSAAAVNPLKGASPIASAAHRLAMLELAIEDIASFFTWDWECMRPGPCYTFDAISHLAGEGIVDLRLILGADAAVALPSWHRAEELVRLAPPLVGLRSGTTLALLPGPIGDERMSDDPIAEALRCGITPICQMEISSTLIRHRLSLGLYCGHLLPHKVLDYILHHGLYLQHPIV